LCLCDPIEIGLVRKKKCSSLT
jgi:hypothetical protein